MIGIVPLTGPVADPVCRQSERQALASTMAQANLGHRPVVIIHADLPCLTAQDVTCLLDAAGTTGAAFAHDLHQWRAMALR